MLGIGVAMFKDKKVIVIKPAGEPTDESR